MVNFENGVTPINDTNLNKAQQDLMTEINKKMFFEIGGSLANAMYWRIGKLNQYFGSLVTLNIWAENGYVETIHLNIGYIAGQGVVLEKIGTASVFGSKPFTKARLVYKGSDCYLELYTPQALSNPKIYMTIHSSKNYMCDFETQNVMGSIPSGYSFKEIDL